MSPTRSAAQIAVTTAGPRPVPELAPTPVRARPQTHSSETDGGLRITAARWPSSPMVEMRLRIPFGGDSQQHAATAELLAETILLGTDRRTRQQVDADLATVGGNLTAQVSPQRLLLSGSVLADGLPVLLDVLADVLSGAAYRENDVQRERERLLEHLTIAAAQPSTIARGHLLRARFGDSPAAWELPDAELVAAATPATVREMHERAVLPGGSALVLVGDLDPEAASEAATTALAPWIGAAATALTTPTLAAPGPILAYHRPDAVQSQTRLSTPALLRTDPGYPAAQLANIVFGGYFSSRLVENLREDKGYTYHAHSGVEFWPQCASLTISYDTATDVAAAALVETRHELGRITVIPPDDQEIEAARNYAIGSLSSSLSTQAGYASMLASLAASGLGGDWLVDYQSAVGAVSVDDVAEAAARLFAPAAISGIIVGDLDATGTTLTRLADVVVAES